MKLTPTEQAMLLDRLELGVIPEVLADTESLNIAVEDATEANESVTAMVKSGHLYLDRLNRIEREVIRDAIEGSTWFTQVANSQCDPVPLSPGKIAGWERNAVSLELVFEAAFGEPITFPRW